MSDKKKNNKKLKKRTSEKEHALTKGEFFEVLTKLSEPIREPSEKGKKQTSE